MKLLIIILLSISIVVESEDTECMNQLKSEKNEKQIKYEKIKREYINLIARQIFNDKTGLYDFIGVDCKKSFENKLGEWRCYIRQSATEFVNGHYKVNPPGVGEWTLIMNFQNNTFLLKE